MAQEHLLNILSNTTDKDKIENTLNFICRTCLGDVKENAVSIQSIFYWSQSNTLSIKSFIELIITKQLDDEKPQQICSYCLRQLQFIDSFRNQCLKSNGILKQIYKSTDNLSAEIKIENIEIESPAIDNSIKEDDSYLGDAKQETVDSCEAIILDNNCCFIADYFTGQNQIDSLALENKNKKNQEEIVKNNKRKKKWTAKKEPFTTIYADEIISNDLCEQCGKTFNSKQDLNHHAQTHLSKEDIQFKYTCQYCLKGFNNTKDFKVHINMHTKEEKFICDICGKIHYNKNNLRLHFKYHINAKDFKCDKCEHRFVTSGAMKDHIRRRHSTARSIACTYSNCSQTFPSEYLLALHLRVHETNYAFVCDICGVAVVSKYRLSQHKKIHTGAEIQKCPTCYKTLANLKSLKRHLRTVHSESRNGLGTPKNMKRIDIAN